MLLTVLLGMGRCYMNIKDEVREERREEGGEEERRETAFLTD